LLYDYFHSDLSFCKFSFFAGFLSKIDFIFGVCLKTKYLEYQSHALQQLNPRKRYLLNQFFLKMKYLQYKLLIISYLLTYTWAIAQKYRPINDTDKMMMRTVMARVFHKNTWTLYGLDAAYVGDNLAKLNPTYISGLLFLDDQTALSDKHIQAYNTIREKVLQQNPQCKFDVVLNPRQYKKTEDLLARMEEINRKIKVDIWFFDFYKAAYKDDYKTVKAAIEYAHSQGQLVGINELDKSYLKIADFATVHDGFGVDMKTREQITQILEEYKIPVGMQINSDPDKTNDDNIHTFTKKWEKHEREALVKRLAKNQITWRFRLMYPVFYPVYLQQHAYNAAKDGNMIQVFLELMKVYNIL
jgi:hypothetical protein